MGYWRQTEDGHSMAMEETGLIWGDQPADIMFDALDKIIAVFKRDVERLPTEDEVKAGLLFSLSYALEQAQEKENFERAQEESDA